MEPREKKFEYLWPTGWLDDLTCCHRRECFSNSTGTDRRRDRRANRFEPCSSDTRDRPGLSVDTPTTNSFRPDRRCHGSEHCSICTWSRPPRTPSAPFPFCCSCRSPWPPSCSADTQSTNSLRLPEHPGRVDSSNTPNRRRILWRFSPSDCTGRIRSRPTCSTGSQSTNILLYLQQHSARIDKRNIVWKLTTIIIDNFIKLWKRFNAHIIHYMLYIVYFCHQLTTACRYYYIYFLLTYIKFDIRLKL